MKLNKLTFKQIIILIHIFIIGLVGYIYLLENMKAFPYFFKSSYSNPLMITKSLVHNIRNNNLEQVKLIVSSPGLPNVDIENLKGLTPLLIAIQTHSNIDIIKELIKRSKPKFENKYKETPLHFSILFMNFEAFELLLNNKWKVSSYHSKNIEELIHITFSKNKNKYNLKSQFLIYWNVYLNQTKKVIIENK